MIHQRVEEHRHYGIQVFGEFKIYSQRVGGGAPKMRANAQVPSRRKRNNTERVRATLRFRRLPREHFASVRMNRNVSNASELNLQ